MELQVATGALEQRTRELRKYRERLDENFKQQKYLIREEEIRLQVGDQSQLGFGTVAVGWRGHVTGHTALRSLCSGPSGGFAGHHIGPVPRSGGL